jgi:lipase ATG15
MAKMASNAYTTPDVDGEWWPLGDWNSTTPFGWEKDADGLRGHVVSTSFLVVNVEI